MFEDPETWVAIAFVILMGVFAYLGVHRMALTALDHRSARIKGELDDARRLKDEAAKVLAEYKARHASAEREAQDIIASTKAAESKIAMAEAQALADVRAAAADAAVSAASTILSQSVKGQVADDLLTKGIAEVRAKLN